MRSSAVMVGGAACGCAGAQRPNDLQAQAGQGGWIGQAIADAHDDLALEPQGPRVAGDRLQFHLTSVGAVEVRRRIRQRRSGDEQHGECEGPGDHHIL